MIDIKSFLKFMSVLAEQEVIFKLAVQVILFKAGVAQHGQRRKTEALIPQGFVGSNPISRTYTMAKLSTEFTRVSSTALIGLFSIVDIS